MLKSLGRVSVGLRAYSTQPRFSATDIEALLDRVKKITAVDNTQGTTKVVRNKKQRQPRLASWEPKEPKEPREKRPFQKRATIDGSKLEEFSDVASSFVSTQPTKKAVKKKTTQKRTPTFTNKLKEVSTAPTPRQRTQRRERTQKREDNKPSIKRTNPNVELISTSYVPEVPTWDSLVAESPLTSQSTESRILKAYRELKTNAEADVSGVLTGKFPVTTDSPFSAKLKTDALKKNAGVVVSCLNKNTTLDYDTKMHLLMPLCGLAPVKQLTAL